MALSRMVLNPTGVKVEPTLFTGASRYSNAFSVIMALSSPPKPPNTLSSWAINNLICLFHRFQDGFFIKRNE
jgi:hypothetical protein